MTEKTQYNNSNKIIKFMQVNLNRFRAGQDLLAQNIEEERICITMGQEQNRTPKLNCFYSDLNNDSFIWTNGEIRVTDYYRGNGFVYITINDIRIFSCYFSPNKNIVLFEMYLSELENEIKVAEQNKKRIIIGGDLNGKSHIFRSNIYNKRGYIVDELLNANDLYVINNGNIPTFSSKNGCSLIDITFASSDIYKSSVKEWRVEVERENLSPTIGL